VPTNSQLSAKPRTRNVGLCYAASDEESAFSSSERKAQSCPPTRFTGSMPLAIRWNVLRSLLPITRPIARAPQTTSGDAASLFCNSIFAPFCSANLVPLRSQSKITLFFSRRASRHADHDPASAFHYQSGFETFWRLCRGIAEFHEYRPAPRRRPRLQPAASMKLAARSIPNSRAAVNNMPACGLRQAQAGPACVACMSRGVAGSLRESPIKCGFV
jgi:hypothetical protein